ncbi:ImmA/IrrE family metallo-endopeptidase [Streptomyces sp. NPDC050803]|uniref:ImmA/IrrE family metallo-endopeptidase n=1 Tax=unclassified Streptomyces TaxID=2593676 RepID=UPI00342C120A
MARTIRKDIGLSGVEDIDGLVEVVASRRGRSIKVMFQPLPSDVSAFCFSTPARDCIVVDETANELTQFHAILHELGHFLLDGGEHDCGAQGNADDDPVCRELVQQFAPALNPEGVVRIFRRSHYATDGERRVEAFATVMLDRHLALRRGKGQDGLAATFAHRRGTGV